jgi:hypothetical protein
VGDDRWSPPVGVSGSGREAGCWWRWAGGLLCGAVGPERLARWAAERCWAGGAVAGCQAGLGCCAGRWVGLEGERGEGK